MKSKKFFFHKHIPIFIFFLFITLSLCVFLYRRTTSNILGTTDTVSSPSTKEFYVPFGTGSNTSTDWADVKGAAAYIDTRLYGKMKKVTFEASISVPSGNQTAYIRLYNATDKHPVWYSEVNIAGSGPEFLISSPIVLDAQNKLYQVQMKSQLGATTNILQSRVHIILY